MEKIRIGVIFGGRSGEHEISIRSAQTVIEQIDKNKYEVVPIAISRDGKWINPAQSLRLFPENVQGYIAESVGKYASDEIALLADTAYKGLTKLNKGDSLETPLDVVFPVLHGTYGEDGTIQGLFEMAGIPYIGCGVLASSCGMDKVVMKTLFRDAGLAMCRYVWFLRGEWEQAPDAVIERTAEIIGFPCFVKPANLGSSVGISKATNAAELRAAIDTAAEYDRKILVEEGLNIREIECAVIGNDNPLASLPGEYIVHDESKKFLDYTEKYSGTGNNEFTVPAMISDELTKKIQKMAIQAFRAIDGSGLARVDFFLQNETGSVLINEINTLPGLTDASGFPKMWAGSGVSFSEIIDRLVEYAFERHADKARNKTAK